MVISARKSAFLRPTVISSVFPMVLGLAKVAGRARTVNCVSFLDLNLKNYQISMKLTISL